MLRRNSYLLLVGFAIGIVLVVMLFRFYYWLGNDDMHSSVTPIHSIVAISDSDNTIKISKGVLKARDASDDLIVGVWFKANRLPTLNSHVEIFSRKGRNIDFGYELRLERGYLGIEPVFKWRDRRGRGGDYRFREVEIYKNEWSFIAVGVFGGKLISCYVVSSTPTGEKKIQLAGSYLLSGVVLPKVGGSLTIFGSDQGPFRGYGGPFILLSGNDLKHRFKRFVLDVSTDPYTIPTYINKRDIVVWRTDFEEKS